MNIDELNESFKDSKPEDILQYFVKTFADKAALASSLGAEDQVLTDMMFAIIDNPNVFTIDTGRLHPETYRVLDATNLKYNTKINVYFPSANEVEKLYKEQGVNGHYENITNRKKCCGIRKTEPLKRALSSLKIWITGLRASQSITRTGIRFVEYDENFAIIKVNPLKNWQEEQVWEYIKKNQVPYNKLHDQGYPSIGCEPCTRAVQPEEDIRGGRWWWENPEHKECGMHIKK